MLLRACVYVCDVCQTDGWNSAEHTDVHTFAFAVFCSTHKKRKTSLQFYFFFFNIESACQRLFYGAGVFERVCVRACV